MRKVQLRMAEAEKRMREDDFISSNNMLLVASDEFGEEADSMGDFPSGGGVAGGKHRGKKIVNKLSS